VNNREGREGIEGQSEDILDFKEKLVKNGIKKFVQTKRY
jgi:hypothetical protein